MRTLLFTAGGSPGQEAIWRLLNTKYNLLFADMAIDNINPIIPGRQKIQIPAATDPNFVGYIERICHENSVDLLIPGVDEELAPILRRKEDFPETTIFLPDLSFVVEMLDKFRMYNAFESKNIEVPVTYLAGAKSLSFSSSVVVKPRTGRGSRDVQIVEPDRLPAAIDSLRGDKSDWIAQEKVEGEEFTVQVISNQQRQLHAIVPILVHEKRGSTVRAEIRMDDDVITYCAEIEAAFSPGGCYNIQLMKTADGRIYCFEINPRISTTFCMLIQLGLEPFEHFLSGNSEPANLPKSTQMSLVRHWVNEMKGNQ